jgi:hypothetical protein
LLIAAVLAGTALLGALLVAAHRRMLRHPEPDT